MNQNNLQTFIAKRIRYLRLTKGLSQEKTFRISWLRLEAYPQHRKMKNIIFKYKH